MNMIVTLVLKIVYHTGNSQLFYAIYYIYPLFLSKINPYTFYSINFLSFHFVYYSIYPKIKIFIYQLKNSILTLSVTTPIQDSNTQ